MVKGDAIECLINFIDMLQQDCDSFCYDKEIFEIENYIRNEKNDIENFKLTWNNRKDFYLMKNVSETFRYASQLLQEIYNNQVSEYTMEVNEKKFPVKIFRTYGYNFKTTDTYEIFHNIYCPKNEKTMECLRKFSYQVERRYFIDFDYESLVKVRDYIRKCDKRIRKFEFAWNDRLGKVNVFDMVNSVKLNEKSLQNNSIDYSLNNCEFIIDGYSIPVNFKFLSIVNVFKYYD